MDFRVKHVRAENQSKAAHGYARVAMNGAFLALRIAESTRTKFSANGTGKRQMKLNSFESA
jgi:hypothetical protein